MFSPTCCILTEPCQGGFYGFSFGSDTALLGFARGCAADLDGKLDGIPGDPSSHGIPSQFSAESSPLVDASKNLRSGFRDPSWPLCIQLAQMGRKNHPKPALEFVPEAEGTL